MKREDIWIAEFIFDQSETAIKLYVIFLTGETDKPILSKDKICFYSRNAILTKLASLGFSVLSDKLDDEIALSYDVSKVMDLILFRSIDNEASLINAINTLLDMIKAINMNLSEEYRTILYLFADHLTFNRRYGKFLKENKISSDVLKDIFYWINGLILSNMVVYQDC
ncbi:MAG: hypothetical protein V4577_11425 [Bacteroidota bacterium]